MFLLEQRVKNNECEKEELFISLGCQVVRNYPEIILEYNDHLTSKIKQDLTFLINNLQICSQLEDRISGLKIGVERLSKKIDESDDLKESRKSKLRLKREDFKRSISIKQKKIEKFNKENDDLLFEIGNSIYNKRLLSDFDEISRLYNLLDFINEK